MSEQSDFDVRLLQINAGSVLRARRDLQTFVDDPQITMINQGDVFTVLELKVNKYSACLKVLLSKTTEIKNIIFFRDAEKMTLSDQWLKSFEVVA